MGKGFVRSVRKKWEELKRRRQERKRKKKEERLKRKHLRAVNGN